MILMMKEMKKWGTKHTESEKGKERSYSERNFFGGYFGPRGRFKNFDSAEKAE